MRAVPQRRGEAQSPSREDYQNPKEGGSEARSVGLSLLAPPLRAHHRGFISEKEPHVLIHLKGTFESLSGNRWARRKASGVWEEMNSGL